MAHKSLVPKQRTLTENETQTTFESWRESMLFHISLDNKSARYLSSGDLKTWTVAEDRGFADDGAEVSAATTMNRAAKAALLNIILGSISSYAPVISHRFVKQQSTSLECIWDRLRSYYGLRKTGGRVLEMMEFRLEQGESREALWERLYSYMEDNLLTRNGGVSHEGVKQEINEEFTPTLLNVLVTCWLHTINPALPSLVRQRFSTQLRSNTVYTLREEISDSIPTLLVEMEEREGNISRAGGFQRGRGSRGRSNNYGSTSYNNQSYGNRRNCCLCKAEGRTPTNHYLSTCPFLPSEDKKFMSRTREVTICSNEESQSDEEEETYMRFKEASIKIVSAPSAKYKSLQDPCCRRVEIIPSPVMEVKVDKKMSSWTLDCGAEANLIKDVECKRLGLTIWPTHQLARMADGRTHLRILGEAHFSVTNGHHTLHFGGLVVHHLDKPVLAGMPFLEQNNIGIQFDNRTIILSNCCKLQYRPVKTIKHASIASVLRVNNQKCILPGGEVSFQLPEALQKDVPVAIEPRTTVPADMPAWIDCKVVLPDTNGNITIRNSTSEPVLLSKHTQVCQVRPTAGILENDYTSSPVEVYRAGSINTPSGSISMIEKSDTCYSNLSTIKVDPSNVLPKQDQARIHQIHKKYEDVFSPNIGCYNGHSGKFSHIINMGTRLPPQRKGRIPIYNRGDMEKLQEKFDELLTHGVLARAEDVDVAVEYVHPSFLIKKASGGHRLVTSFGEVAEYARPQPTTTSNVEHVLHQVGQWKYLIKADLKAAYYQIPLSPESARYAGVLTPYRGTFVYLRSVMGLPGSEAALEELLSRIFGDLIREGSMIKLADDLYIGSSSFEDLIVTWDEVLRRLLHNGLKLSPDKTVCCPTTTTILGWEWERGTIRPSSHRLNALAACEPPATVKGLRSYIGCFKFLSRVLPCYAEVLHPLEEYCGGKQSADKVIWSDQLTATFNASKELLQKVKPVVLPRYDDQLHIVTDAAVNCAGLAATLFVVRKGKPVLAGYFSATLRKGQSKLLPCEMEALAIGVSIKHFTYYISQSHKRTRVMTDSRPCVLAYRKLMKGEFSSSTKVTTFLSLASRYGVEILHIAGSDNVFSDYSSRNPVKCNTAECEICKFVHHTSISSVGEVKVSDILAGESRVPFSTNTSWLNMQQACPDLSKVYKYLTTGATIPKKKKQMTNVRRYLNCGVMVSSGQHPKLLIIRHTTPFKPTADRVVIPRKVSEGLLTALHVQLNHPSANQLKLVFSRAYFCLDLDASARNVVEGCHTCAALKKIPSNYHKQSTSAPAEVIGSKYSADVVRRYNQCILLIREDISSYTEAALIDDEKADTLRNGIILLVSRLRSPLGPEATIRTDPATSLRSLIDDKQLSQLNVSIELGEAKNINKNPIAEKGIQELHAEIVRLRPLGGKISSTLLAQAVSNLNSRIRENKLSAIEIWTTREMTTGKQLSMDDKKLIEGKQSQRLGNHEASSKYKARGKKESKLPAISTGDIIYLYSDRSKWKRREKYIVTEVDKETVSVQKFTNSQFRGRVYKVKKTDVITVQKIPVGNNPPAETKSKPDRQETLKTTKQPPNQTNSQFPKQDKDEESDSSEDDDDDTHNPHPLAVQQNQPQVAPLHNRQRPEVVVDEREEEEGQILAEADLGQQARPTREKRTPGYLDDYVTDMNEVFDEDDNDVDVRHSDEEDDVDIRRSARLRSQTK